LKDFPPVFEGSINVQRSWSEANTQLGGVMRITSFQRLPCSALRCSGALGHDSTEKGGFARFFGRYFAWAASYFGTLQLASFSEPARQRTQDFNPDGDYTMDQSAKEEKYFLN
jgi:hypothetical protein